MSYPSALTGLATISLAAALMSAPLTPGALAADAYLGTGGAPDGSGSIYHQGYALPIAETLDQALRMMLYDTLSLRPSAGSGANITACAAERDHLCFGLAQGDVAAVSPAVTSGDVLIVRNDLPAECAFAFASNEMIGNWKTVQKYARKITLYLPPENSGTTITLRQVIEADPAMAGAEITVKTIDGGWSEIVRAVEADPRGVGATVRYPDPSVLLDDLADKGFSVFGIAVPELLRLRLPSGEPIYTVNGAAPYTDPFLSTPETIATVCTPAAIVATNPERIDDPVLKEDMGHLIEALEALKSDDLVPAEGSKARIFKTVRAFSEKIGFDQVINWWGDEVAVLIPDLER